MIWIAWENQRRNYSFSAELGADLHVFDYSGYGSFVRYILSSLKTILLFLKNEKIYFVQNPSIALAFLSVAIRRTFRRDIILFIDTHNAGLFPFDGKYRILNWASKLIVSEADYIIVTNQNLASTVARWKGNAVIAEDPLPSIARPGAPSKLVGKKNVLFICSYSEDEPHMEVAKACFLLEKDVVIYMTGRVRADSFDENFLLPPNLIVTGFLSQSEFDSFLLGVDCVMVLTTRTNCLVCGGYEAVAASKPLILSDTEALRTFFCKGAIYCKNEPESIAKSINCIIKDIDHYANDISVLKDEMSANWEKRKEHIYNLIKHKKDL